MISEYLALVHHGAIERAVKTSAYSMNQLLQCGRREAVSLAHTTSANHNVNARAKGAGSESLQAEPVLVSTISLFIELSHGLPIALTGNPLKVAAGLIRGLD